MKITHEKTKTLIVDILGDIRTLGNNAKTYRTERLQTESNDTLSQKYQQDLITNLRENYLANLEKTKDIIKEKLSKILDFELEQEKILEFDVPEFANTINAINASQGNLPIAVIETIKTNFAGQYQILNTIKETFERYGINVNEYGYEEYTKSAVNDIKKFIDMTTNIEQSEVAIYPSLKQLFDCLLRFGEVRGLYFTESEKSFGEANKEEYENIIARKAMGLNY